MDIKNFTECSEEELILILSWRNRAEVRSASFNDETIPLEHHLEFVKSLIIGGGNHDKFYFLASDEAGYLGVISFTGMTETSAEIGYYKNPKRTEKGVGVILLKLACHTAKNRFMLKEAVTEVLGSNPASIISIERAGFKEQTHLTGNLSIERNDKKIDIITYKRKL